MEEEPKSYGIYFICVGVVSIIFTILFFSNIHSYLVNTMFNDSKVEFIKMKMKKVDEMEDLQKEG